MKALSTAQVPCYLPVACAVGRPLCQFPFCQSEYPPPEAVHALGKSVTGHEQVSSHACCHSWTGSH